MWILHVLALSSVTESCISDDGHLTYLLVMKRNLTDFSFVFFYLVFGFLLTFTNIHNIHLSKLHKEFKLLNR